MKSQTLRQITLIWLPALAALYSGIAGIWGLGYVSDVVGTLTAVDTFLGVVLHLASAPPAISGAVVADGNLVVNKSDPLKDVYSIELNTPVEEIDNKEMITLAVLHST